MYIKYKYREKILSKLIPHKLSGERSAGQLIRQGEGRGAVFAWVVHSLGSALFVLGLQEVVFFPDLVELFHVFVEVLVLFESNKQLGFLSLPFLPLNGYCFGSDLLKFGIVIPIYHGNRKILT